MESVGMKRVSMKSVDMNEDELDRGLRKALSGLPRELSPGRDLWPGIEHGLAARRARPAIPRRLPYLLAASVLMLAVFLTWSIQQPADQQTAPSTASLLDSMKAGHEANKQGLLVNYQDQTPYYEGWQEHMQQLEDTEALLFEALQQNPSNLELLPLLQQVQRKQLELINAVHAPRLSSI